MSYAENPSAATPSGGSSPGMPSETVRTIVTLAIFVHLFIAVVAAVGAMRAPSELFIRLNLKFVTELQYPQYLLLSNFAYPLTYNRDVDYDGSAEIVLDWDAAYESQPERIPAEDRIVLFDADAIKLPIRRQRYLTLIRRMTDVAASQPPSPREIDMPKSVSKALLSDMSAMPEGVHRFRLLRIPTPAASYTDERQTPVLPPAYQGNIAIDARGNLEFVKADRTSLVAPPTPSRTPAASQIPPIGGEPGDPAVRPRSPLPLDLPGRSDGNH